ncbi:hypothetical protein Kisp01_03890 [Kineosporia sp. NBRC 101677]|uniref:hypothetical protein n=1 Tax=Kineosporia sp. NBRC 101677 TaxID=3032197 RepID=UPI0024A5A8CA|nr:hypothetical protein [Kineosporia sp. NBRC 101677]GLY13373.1 hypothetical protein Kisp01_03890 [Kineosporia sp. NBRC 101677]
MSEQRPRLSERRQKMLVALGFTISGSALLSLGISLAFGGLDEGAKVADVISAVVAAVGLPVTVLLMIIDPMPSVRVPSPRTGEWYRRVGGWLTAVEVVVLPAIGIAVLRRPGIDLYDALGVVVILLPLILFWPGVVLRWPSRGAEYLFRCIALPVVLLSITAAAWDVMPLPGRGPDGCGTARIEVDQALLPAVQQVFAANRSRLGSAQECAGAVEFAALGSDPHAALRTAQTPVAGVITADPAVLQGLSGVWADLAVGVTPPAGWHLVGQVPAVIYLDESDYRTRTAVPLAELAERRIDLHVRDVTPLDPVASAVLHAAADQRIERRRVDLGDEQACLGVVLPAGLDSACAASGRDELGLEDAQGNIIGAEVLAIPTNPEGRRTSAKSAHAFLSWLQRTEARNRIGLVASTAQPADVAARAAVLAPAEKPLEVTVLLDMSQSMGVAGDGATSPGTAARDGLLQWASTKPLDAEDQLTVILARTGAGASAARTVKTAGAGVPRLRLPDVRPGGETGLAEVLGEPSSGALILLTDGRNALQEAPIPAAARKKLQVVVIGAGCGGQPEWARERCRSTDANSEHIADQLTALIEEA